MKIVRRIICGILSNGLVWAIAAVHFNQPEYLSRKNELGRRYIHFPPFLRVAPKEQDEARRDINIILMLHNRKLV
ncbi:hypothetical protein F5B20DRAFT_272287 [Whalleya microplaca]|nr:hypothetical protein F5B20DRAFT_272287 [Whalleya microplaca]